MYLAFVMILVMMSYGTADTNANLFKRHLDSHFVKKGDVFRMDYTRVRLGFSWRHTRHISHA